MPEWLTGQIEDQQKRRRVAKMETEGKRYINLDATILRELQSTCFQSVSSINCLTP